MALGKPPRPDRSRLGSRRDAGTERARLRASRRSDGDDRLCGPARGDDDGAQPRGRCEHDRDVDAARPDLSARGALVWQAGDANGPEWTSVGEGKRVSVSVDLGGRRSHITKTKQN